MVEDAKAMGGVDLAELYLDRVGNVGLPVDREQVQGTAACLALLLADHTEALLGALLRVLKNQLDDLEDLCVAGVFAARLSGLPPDMHVPQTLWAAHAGECQHGPSNQTDPGTAADPRAADLTGNRWAVSGVPWA